MYTNTSMIYSFANNVVTAVSTIVVIGLVGCIAYLAFKRVLRKKK